ncbi:hypothetical protein JW711_03730 [Candidatus Woesearchaeota archaeon]|nr:hypothetical protein [Candidatus Woesearchaeota archaeon]
MSEFMGKKINFFLVIMIMLVLCGMGMLSIYYQVTFKNFDKRFQDLNQDYGSCQQNLTYAVSTLQQTIRNLNNTESDIRKYDTLYEQKAQELSDIESTLKETQTKLQSETMFKEQFKKKAENYEKQILEQTEELEEIRKQNNALQFQVNVLNERVECLDEEIESYEYTCYE